MCTAYPMRFVPSNDISNSSDQKRFCQERGVGKYTKLFTMCMGTCVKLPTLAAMSTADNQKRPLFWELPMESSHVIRFGGSV